MQNSDIIFGLISRKSKNKNLKTLFIEGDDGGGAKKKENMNKNWKSFHMTICKESIYQNFVERS